VGNIEGFWVQIYSNDPGPPYSQPDELLWESFITDYTAQEIQTPVPEGWYDPLIDLYAYYNHNAHYQYDITDIEDPFYQEEGTIYWLSVYAIVEGTEVWGWKSSENHWEDDACWRLFDPPPPGSWQELYEPTLAAPVSMDMAFIIYGSEAEQPCLCSWNEVTVEWTDASGNQTWTGSCGATLSGISPVGALTVSSSVNCTGDCSPQDYSWEVTAIPGSTTPIPSSGPGLSAVFYPQGSGIQSYEVTLYASCDSVECPLCTIAIMRVSPPEECQCEDWSTVQVYWTDENHNPVSWPVACGGSKNLNSIEGEIIMVDASNSIGCTPDCRDDVPTAYWTVTGPSGGPTPPVSGLIAQFVPEESGSYQVEFYNVYCDNVECLECSVTINVKLESPCQCGDWSPIEITWDDGNPRTTDAATISCNTSTWLTSLKGGEVFVTAGFTCIPSSCALNYSWEVIPPQGQSPVYGSSSGGEVNFSFYTAVEGSYVVTLNATCGGVVCPPCEFTLIVSLD